MRVALPGKRRKIRPNLFLPGRILAPVPSRLEWRHEGCFLLRGPLRRTGGAQRGAYNTPAGRQGEAGLLPDTAMKPQLYYRAQELTRKTKILLVQEPSRLGGQRLGE